MPTLENDEQNVHVIFSFFKEIVKLSKQFKTNKFIYCWDSKLSLRKKIYPRYKENRRKRLDDSELVIMNELFRQMKYIRKTFLPNLGFKNIFHYDYLEADDLIASIIKTNSRNFVIITSDNDLLQLLRKNVSIFNPNKKKLIDIETFLREYNITPEQWVVVKTIAGCSTDNVKGVSGIGEKTAIKYINNMLNKKTKTYEKIVTMSDLNRDTNKLLVQLPFHFTPKIKLNKELLYRDKFHNTLKELQFISFLIPGKWNELIKNFNLK